MYTYLPSISLFTHSFGFITSSYTKNYVKTLEPQAAGKSLKKLSKKQQYEMFGIRDRDHKMKEALKYVLSSISTLCPIKNKKKRDIRKTLRDALRE